MSKFFRGAVSSSDTSDSESEDAEDVQQTGRPRAPVARDFGLPSDSEEETKRVVKTHKDRKFEELKDKIKQSKNMKNIKDISKLQQLFEELVKLFEKSKTVMARANLSTPRFYIRYIVELEDFVNKQWEDKDAKKTMSKINAKSLTTLRQKVRKYTKDMEKEVEAYRAEPDPQGYSSAEEVGDDDDEQSGDEAPAAPDEVAKPKEKVVKQKRPQESDEEESDLDWASDSDSESSGSELDLDTRKMEDLRKYFLKKEFRDDVKDEKEQKRRDKQRDKKVVKEESDDDDEEWTPVTPKENRPLVLFEPKQEITHEAMINKLSEVIASRGRKATNRKHQVRTLQELYKITDEKNLGAGLLTKILFAIISSLFELNTRISDYMDFGTWQKTLMSINSLLDLLESSPNVELSIRVSDEEENVKDATQPFRVHGSVLMSVERLDTELTKILQNADCHSTDYIDKLKGEKELCQLIVKTQKYMDERLDSNLFINEEVCKMYMLRIEHLYYKYEETAMEGGDEERPSKTIAQLCNAIYAKDDEKRLRQRAVLCHVYHMALHDKWHEARDLMLMSHLQAIVDHSDVSTQILYNRTICQLGLCAFRHGFIKEAHQGLSEIQNTQRAKELLAQGLVTRMQERTAEQEKVERSRQVPYHMHINVELMECVYLICSMLLEIPNMASHEYELRRRLLSRSFHYQLKQSEKASLVGPPENTREHVVAASRAMLSGDWKKCRDYIVNDKMNTKVWNLFRNSERVKTMVVRRIQEESLRTYLLMNSTVYNTVSLDKLANLFELDRRTVHSIISRMVITEELAATLDEPTDCLIMHRVEPSRLQLLALHLTEKIANLAENNEQILEPRTGRAGYAGAGGWYGQRSERTEDKRSGTQRNVTFQGDRRDQRFPQDKRQWKPNQGNRRREGATGGRY